MPPPVDANAAVYFLLHIPRTAGQTIQYHLAEHGAPGTVWIPRRAPLPLSLIGQRYRGGGPDDPARVRAVAGHDVEGIGAGGRWRIEQRPHRNGVLAVDGPQDPELAEGGHRRPGRAYTRGRGRGGSSAASWQNSFGRKRPDPVPLVFGYHELFPALTLVAVTCQYVAIAFFVIRVG